MSKELENLQNDVKVLKGEIKQTLTDIREFLLTKIENPFPLAAASAGPGSQMAVQASMANPMQHQGEGSGNAQPQMPGQVSRVTVMDGAGAVQFGNGAQPTSQPTVQAVQSQSIQAPRQSGEGARATDQNGGAPPSDVVTPPQPGPDAKPIAERHKAEATHDSAPAGEAQQPGRSIREAAAARALDDDSDAEVEQLDEATTPAGSQETDAEPDNLTSPEPGHMKKGSAMQTSTDKADMVTVALFTPWVEEGLRRIGRERLVSVIGLYNTMGGLSPQLKDILLRLVKLDARKHAPPSPPTLRDCEYVLAELDDLVKGNRDDKARAALVYRYLRQTHAAHPEANGKASHNAA